MNRFKVLKLITDAEKFSDLVFDMVIAASSKKALTELLVLELSEEELQTLESIAQSNYPLFFEGKQ